jgi:hypothetical protein
MQVCQIKTTKIKYSKQIYTIKVEGIGVQPHKKHTKTIYYLRKYKP